MKKPLFAGLILLAAAFTACRQSPRTLSVMCIGNSITQGKVTGDSITELSYRYWLWEKLDSAGYMVDFTGGNSIWFNEDRMNPVKHPVSPYTGHVFDNDHESYYGINTREFLKGGFVHDSVKYASFAERIRPFKPDVALIHLGSNDDEKDSAESIHNLEEIINVLYRQDPSTAVILAKLNTPWKGFINNSVDGIVRREKAAHPGLLIHTVDMASGWVNRPDLPGTMTLDWAHPNTKGQKIMAEKWYRAIESLHDSVPPQFDNPGLTFKKTTDTTLLVSWQPAMDDKWVEGYDVFVDGEKVNWRYSGGESHDRQCLALVPGTQYVIEGKLPEKGSRMTVSACDYGNNCTSSREVIINY